MFEIQIDCLLYCLLYNYEILFLLIQKIEKMFYGIILFLFTKISPF